MKRIAFLILAVMASALAAVGQAESIECGPVNMRLGAPEAKARQSLAAAGYDINTSEAPLLSAVNLTTKDSCTISFTGGKLVYASRYWTSNIKTELDAVRSVVDALQAITPIGQRSACEIFPYKKTSPTLSNNSVDISCNGHNVEIQSMTVNGNPMYNIEESIGEYPALTPR